MWEMAAAPLPRREEPLWHARAINISFTYQAFIIRVCCCYTVAHESMLKKKLPPNLYTMMKRDFPPQNKKEDEALKNWIIAPKNEEWNSDSYAPAAAAAADTCWSFLFFFILFMKISTHLTGGFCLGVSVAQTWQRFGIELSISNKHIQAIVITSIFEVRKL